MHVCRRSYHKQPLMSVGESKWTGEGMGQGHYCKQVPPEAVSADPYYFSALAPGRKCIFASQSGAANWCQVGARSV